MAKIRKGWNVFEAELKRIASDVQTYNEYKTVAIDEHFVPAELRLIKQTNCLLFASLRYFCENFFNGSQKKIERIILAIVFYFNRCINFCCCCSLALAYVDYAFCRNFLCVGHGHHLNLDLLK